MSIKEHVRLAQSGTREEKGDAAAALSNLAANNAENRVAIAQANGIAVLVELAGSGNEEAKTKAASALQPHGGSNGAALFFKAEIIQQLVRRLPRNNPRSVRSLVLVLFAGLSAQKAGLGHSGTALGRDE
jgi:hypothetical protein